MCDYLSPIKLLRDKSELLFKLPDDVCVVGYLQTEKYFKHIEDEIRKDFTFRKEFEDGYEEAKDMFDNPVALHIRRGDFIINHANHDNLSLSYYEKALKEFGDDRQVVIFSDDTVWSKHPDKKYRYSHGKVGEVIINDGTDISDVSDNTYDFLFASHTLEHIANPLKALFMLEGSIPSATLILPTVVLLAAVVE